MENEKEWTPRVFKVKSEADDDKTYFITWSRPTKISCTCPDYIYRSKDTDGYATGHKCKHIRHIMWDVLNDE